MEDLFKHTGLLFRAVDYSTYNVGTLTDKVKLSLQQAVEVHRVV
jgi:hypothetical protein